MTEHPVVEYAEPPTECDDNPDEDIMGSTSVLRMDEDKLPLRMDEGRLPEELAWLRSGADRRPVAGLRKCDVGRDDVALDVV